jgi:hypothetical protein
MKRTSSEGNADVRITRIDTGITAEERRRIEKPILSKDRL